METAETNDGPPVTSSATLRRVVLRSGPPAWVTVALAVMAGFGPPLAPVTGGLDSSWQLGLSWARTLGLRWGSEVVFTYGPLGAAAAPVPLTASLMWQALVLQLLALTLVACACRSLVAPRGGWWALFVTIPVTTAAASSGLATALFLGVVLSGVALALRSSCMHHLAWLPGAFAGLGLLVKFNTGFAAIAAGTVAMLAATRRGHALAGFLAGSAAAALGGWFGAGGRASDLVPWVRGSFELAVGYSSAMRHVRPDLAGWLPFAALAFGAAMATLFCALAWRSAAGLEVTRRAALTVAVLLSVTALYLASATRLDAGHLGLLPCGLFALGIPLAGALGAGARSLHFSRFGPASAATAALSLCCIGVSLAILGTDGLRQFLHPVRSFETLRSEIWLATSSRAREETLASQMAAIRDAYPVPPWELRTLDPPAATLAGPSPAVVDAVRAMPVHVEPWAVSLAWAHGLDWDPMPVMQTYAAYTSRLDELNAATLTSVAGPEAILRQSAAIDGKHPLWESPRYQLAMLCNFAQRESDGRWQALVRAGDRCGRPRPLGTVVARPGENVAVPDAAGALVIAELSLSAAAGGRSRTSAVVYCGERRYVVAQGVPSGPLVVRAGASGWDSRTLPAPCETLGADAKVEMAFTAVGVSVGDR